MMVKGGTVQSKTAHCLALHIVAAFLNLVYCGGIAGAMDGNLRSSEWWTMTSESYCGMLFLMAALTRLLMLSDFAMQYGKAMFRQLTASILMEI